MARAVAATPALALAGSPAPALARRFRAERSGLPHHKWVRRHVREMVELGTRLPATKPHLRFVDWIESEFQEAGLIVERDPHPFQRWQARRWSLEVLDGPGAGQVPVASYYTYSGKTPAKGVTGKLVSLGSLPPNSADPNSPGGGDAYAAALTAALSSVPGGAAGNIVLADAPIAPLKVGAFDPLLTYRHDPDGTINADSDYKRAWTTLLTLPVLDPFKAAGAAGVVFILDASPENAAGQYTPFIWGYKDIPALIVDRDSGARLRESIGSGTQARLVLEAGLRDASSDSLVATLPGGELKDEVAVVNTHTDGQNAFEENGPVACVALAKYFAGLPRSRRRRTLVFSCVTGHFSGAGQPQTEGFIEDHPELIERAAAAVTIEHFGSREWNDDASGYHSTGQTELGVIFHSETKISEPGIAAMKAKDLRRSQLLKPIGPTFFGVGASLHMAGVPSLAFIAGPNYLLALDGKHGHLDKFDSRRMAREIAWTADALHRIDAMSREQLASR